MNQSEKKSKREKEPQLRLGLEYSGNKLFDYLRYRINKWIIVLDQFSFWRSPLLWLVIFMNGTFTYGVFHLLLTERSFPPTIPLLYYLPDPSAALFSVTQIPYLILFYLIGQAILVYLSARLFYRAKDLSSFTLFTASLITLLFFVTLYKSILLIRPAP